jgi:hypothetical protein
MDDHSRYLVGFGLHASASGALVREAFLGAVVNCGLPEEVLTDQGPQLWSSPKSLPRMSMETAG